MIVKELEQFQAKDKYQEAGRAAEEQMQFYLKRFFEDDKDIFILNNIRIQTEKDAAQVDHLVIHTYGMIFIESKSISGKIQLKNDGQWVRWFNDKSTGMASPITQVEMQRDFFRKELNKVVTPKDYFLQVPFDTLVAISEKGEFLSKGIERPKEIWKADQIPAKIKEIINGRKTEKPMFTEKMLKMIAEYLQKKHTPLTKNNEQNKNALQKCPQCKSENLEIKYGHSYYFSCINCKKKFAIPTTLCEICNKPEKLRKNQNEYFKVCDNCKTAKKFHKNPS